jgi:hypothetical protein
VGELTSKPCKQAHCPPSRHHPQGPGVCRVVVVVGVCVCGGGGETRRMRERGTEAWARAEKGTKRGMGECARVKGGGACSSVFTEARCTAWVLASLEVSRLVR